jgi:cytoskeleton-associated protein 5
LFQIKRKKWQEREGALKALHNLLSTEPTRLAPGDYTEVCLALKEVIRKDANVMLVALATRCLAGLARGLESHVRYFHIC